MLKFKPQCDSVGRCGFRRLTQESSALLDEMRSPCAGAGGSTSPLCLSNFHHVKTQGAPPRGHAVQAAILDQVPAKQ